jgi:antitoxin (DNA-binding transcriptional repressor) of toxin-antitoxin stability system
MTAVTIGVRELRMFTRSILKTVREIGSVTVVDRGHPVAQVVAIDEDEARLITSSSVTSARPRFAMPTRQVPEGRPNATESLLRLRGHEDVTTHTEG